MLYADSSALPDFWVERSSTPLSEVQDDLDFLQSYCRTAYSNTSSTSSNTSYVQLLLLVTGKAKQRVIGYVALF